MGIRLRLVGLRLRTTFRSEDGNMYEEKDQDGLKVGDFTSCLICSNENEEVV